MCDSYGRTPYCFSVIQVCHVDWSVGTGWWNLYRRQATLISSECLNKQKLNRLRNFHCVIIGNFIMTSSQIQTYHLHYSNISIALAQYHPLYLFYIFFTILSESTFVRRIH